MIPELGKYAGTVLGGYAIALALLAILVGLSIRRARRSAERLSDLEAKHRK